MRSCYKTGKDFESKKDLSKAALQLTNKINILVEENYVTQ